MDIKDADLNDLLETLADRDPKQQSLVDKWLIADGVFAGTTRTKAIQIYPQYVAWHQLHYPNVPVPGIRVWGKEMSDKFKKGRGNYGVHYYISRERDVFIPPSLQAGGGARGGGGDPVGGELKDDEIPE